LFKERGEKELSPENPACRGLPAGGARKKNWKKAGLRKFTQQTRKIKERGRKYGLDRRKKKG